MLCWRPETKVRMTSPRVVEAPAVLRDRKGRPRAALPFIAIDQLLLDRRKEALAHGIDAQQLPFRLMLQTIPSSERAPRYCALAYWLPRSE
jgi:hypothetical protein